MWARGSRRRLPGPGAGRRGGRERLRVVVDANVVAAALIRPGGWTATELRRTDVEWVAPEPLLDELAEHEAEYSAKAECALAEWRERVGRLRERIRWIGTDDLAEAASAKLVRRVARVDPDDAVYAAALVAAEGDLIWTRDAALLAALPGRAVRAVPRAGE